MNHYSTEFFPRTCDIQSPFSSYSQFVPAPEPEKQPELQMDMFVDPKTGEPDQLMQEKQEIVESRGEVKRGKIVKKGKQKNKRLPGEKLMRKIEKEQNFERIMAKVVKGLVN